MKHLRAMLLARHRAGQTGQQPPILQALLPKPFITQGWSGRECPQTGCSGQGSSFCLRLLGFLETSCVVV